MHVRVSPNSHLIYTSQETTCLFEYFYQISIFVSGLTSVVTERFKTKYSYRFSFLRGKKSM